jgi:hypothetical protein
MRPLVPAEEFLDQHLDVFQAASYEMPESCLKIESGSPEAVDLNLFCAQGIVENLLESKVITIMSSVRLGSISCQNGLAY